jgi:glycosyltransferase involved in cell wall biosynthesis/putative flippase GtrA
MRKSVAQFVKFSLAGAAASVLNLALLYAAVTWLGLHYITANIGSYMVAVAAAFFVNRSAVFKSGSGRTGAKLAKYAAMRACVIALDSALLFALVDMAGAALPISKIAVMAVTTAVSFGGTRRILADGAGKESQKQNRKVKILAAVNYYSPYVSGVTETARVACEELARLGCDVTVVAANHAGLAADETISGVRVLRTPVQLRIGKGTVSAGFIARAAKCAAASDAVILFTPMLESGLLSLFTDKRKLLAVHCCDVFLGKGMLNALTQAVMDASMRLCFKRARRIFGGTMDYMSQSRTAGRYISKCVETGFPIKPYLPDETARRGAGGKKRIGFCGRIVEEKGIDVLLAAFRIIRERRSDVELIIGGDHENVAGGSVYPQLREYCQRHWLQDVHFPGKIPESEMAAFYTSLDVFVLPSINTMESFGMVQAEAMRCGTPVVASNLPGVRQTVLRTGMGRICEIGNAASLAECVADVLDNPERYIKPLDLIAGEFSTEKVIASYIGAIDSIIN